MNVNFNEVAADSTSPVIFEQVIGEKPGGGIVANQAWDVLPGTAVGFDGTVLKPIKAYRLVKAVAANDTTIEIAKGSGIAIGDIIAHNGVGVESTNLNQTNATKDVVTVTLGIVVATGTVLYQAAAESEAATAEVVDGTGHTTTVGVAAVPAAPIYTPKYLTGATLLANKGDQPVKLVIAAIVRKETVNAAPAVLALLPTINAV